MRAFIALDVPGSVKDSIESVRGGLDFGGVVFVKREAMHVTLQFLGEIGDRDAELAMDAMRGIPFAPFRVGLRGLSYFSPGFVKVIFAKVAEGAEELTGLCARLDRALSEKGIGLDREGYVPHLTVARVKGDADRRGIVGAIGTYAETDFGSFEARSIVLKKSVLAKDGPVYTDLYELEFRPEPGETV